ncbi:exo-alpha-sialidase [Rothia sp. CCM 9418]|uniref:exo-alpha-sialidase n=1 Tax=Rothia sp. CCM 9418 TaxID=3402661 RepID=UPI003AECC6B2
MKKHTKSIFALSLIAATASTGIIPAYATPQPVLSATSGPGTYQEQNLGEKLIGDSATYRIPALADLGNNIILAAWDGRPYNAADAPNPNSIVMRRSIDGGKTWSDTSYIARGHLGNDGTQKYGYSDPSFVVDHEAGKVFAFFVKSHNQGFWGSVYGNDTSDPDVMGAVVTESTDGGLTWSEPRDITPIVKQGADKNNPQPGDARAIFAASGEGIQLRYGAYKGRLIQQFTGTVKQAAGGEKTQAYSVYSDDHGKTWKRGEYVGIEMDENKVVELSDGRVMLNSRDFVFSGYRKVAISEDGGHSYSEVTLDKQLPDPKNNASIFRMFPEAPQGSKEAQKLIFTNSNNNNGNSRENLTARVSCDDGQTWPGIRQFKDGFGAYSTGTALSSGGFGVLYEASYQNDMRFGVFDEDWLNVVCAPLNTEDITVDENSVTTIPVTITNQEEHPVSGSVTVHDNRGFTATDVNVPTLDAGASTVVNIPLTATAQARSGSLDVVFTEAQGKQSRYTFSAQVNRTSEAPFHVTLSEGQTTERDVSTNPYHVGDVVPYTFRVTNTSGETVDAVPTGGNLDRGFLPPNAPNCRWRNLGADATYVCKTAGHTVTQEDIDRGYFIPEITFNAVSTADRSKTGESTYRGEPVYVRAINLEPALNISGDIAGDTKDSYEVGNIINYRFTVHNASEGTVHSVPIAGNFENGFLPPNAPNCRWLNLKADATYQCHTASHRITEEDLERGYFQPEATFEVTSTETQKTAQVEFRGEKVTVHKTTTEEPATPEPSNEPEVSTPYFHDVRPGDLFYTEINWMGESGISHGWPDKTYRPLTQLDRAAVAAFFYRMAGSPEYTAPAVSPFKDVPTDHVFYKEISWLAEQGITTGWEDGTFRPHAPAQHDAIAVFFYRFAGSPEYTAPVPSMFKDVDSSVIFAREIAWFAEQGITRGWDDGTYRPYQPTQRDAMAAFIYRYMNDKHQD